MALKPEQLPDRLARSLDPVYLLAGAEPLLVQECRDQVIQAAQAQGFHERSVHEAGRGFEWSRLSEDSSAPSLFSARKILDIRLPTGKPGKEGARVLGELALAGDPDVLLLVSCGEWGAAMRKLKWTGQLAGAGVLVEIWPVKPQQLPGWIRARMQRAGLRPDPEAVSLLAELVEGNLLAAHPEIEKLRLRDRDERVTVDDVTQSVANSSRFDAFRLVDCALRGSLGESLRVASGLQRNGVAIQVVTGALYREMSLVESVNSALSGGEDAATVFGRLRIWPARQGPIRDAGRRLGSRGCGEVLRRLSLIDRQSKGRAAGDAWQSLDHLLCYLCNPETAPAR